MTERNGRKNIIVIGGGAAGMMAAVTAAKTGASVTIVEKNEKLGKKVYITGKGRCNVTNDCTSAEFLNNVMSNPKFLYSAGSAFTSKDTCDFFEKAGLRLKVERGNRVFPESDKSSDVIKALTDELKKNRVKILLNTEVKDIDPKRKKIELGDASSLSYDRLIIATGGLSYQSTGSTGDGYKFAAKLGHKIIKPIPSLVPILVRERYVKYLEGLSLKNVSIKIAKDPDGKAIYEDFGEMIFTADGVSGPMILSATGNVGRLLSEAQSGEYKIYINLKPALDSKQLDARILKDFGEMNNKEYKNALGKLLPSKIIPVVIELSGIDPDKRINEINKKERARLLRTLTAFPLTIKALDGFEHAVITKGGVDIKKVDPKTMESKLHEDIYFAGEVMDVDAYTGGFNLQIAFCTGVAAGLAAATKEK